MIPTGLLIEYSFNGSREQSGKSEGIQEDVDYRGGNYGVKIYHRRYVVRW